MSTRDNLRASINYHKKELARLEAEAATKANATTATIPVQMGGSYKAQKYKSKFDNLVKDLKTNHNYTDERIAEIMKEGGFDYPVINGGNLNNESVIEPAVEMIENVQSKSALILPNKNSYEYKTLKYKTKLDNLRTQIKQQYGKTDAELDSFLDAYMKKQNGGNLVVSKPQTHGNKDEAYKTEKYKFKLEQLRKKLNAQGIDDTQIDNYLKNN